MNYIYDIYLNLNETLYDFFEWNKKDKITHIKKIPIFKIEKDIFNKIVLNKFKIHNKTLTEIFNRTEIWNVKEKINYCSIFTDGDNLIAVEFDSDGSSIKKSQLLIDEELEILESIYKIKKIDLKIDIKTKEKISFKSRKEIKEENFIINELNNMEEKKLNYIYFECFGKKNINKDSIIKSIKGIPKDSKLYKNLYDILKLTSTSKK